MKKVLLVFISLIAGSYANAQIVITGFANDVKGLDTNNEYIQLLATEDLDFSKNAFSVVTCTNAGTALPNPGEAPIDGWATGGGRTYKFDLKNGTVKSGEFFYVGGINRKMNGAKSMDIKDAKWIRTIDYKNVSGDGFGEAKAAILPNVGNAGGIAVFVGTAVEESSIPIDVVFFGGKGKATIINQSLGRGYRVANNDHYNSNSGSQPFFLQGKNTYIIPYLTPADQGAFIKLGAIYNTSTKKWQKERTYDYFMMSESTVLNEIEKGNAITALVK